MVDIVYDIPEVTQKVARHTLAVLVDNEFGVLARVISLFSGRGYNIESLTVAEVEHDKKLSRITIVTSGSEMVIEQIKKLLERMVPVHKVNDLTVEGKHVERELALVTVKESKRAADAAKSAGARLVNSASGNSVYELTGTSKKVDDFLELIRPLGMVETARSGVVAISAEKK